jgi:hypothetical protein
MAACCGIAPSRHRRLSAAQRPGLLLWWPGFLVRLATRAQQSLSTHSVNSTQTRRTSAMRRSANRCSAVPFGKTRPETGVHAARRQRPFRFALSASMNGFSLHAAVSCGADSAVMIQIKPFERGRAQNSSHARHLNCAV